MSFDRDEEDEARLRDLLEQSRRAANLHDEIPDDDILHIRPKPLKKKKQLLKREE